MTNILRLLVLTAVLPAVVFASSGNAVLAGVLTHVEMSASDVNHVTCPGIITDVIVSREKAAVVEFSGRNIFVKFLGTRKSDGRVEYPSDPVDIHVTCSEEVYSIIAHPKKIPSQTIRLSSGARKRMATNRELFDGMPLEKKILEVITRMVKGDMPEGFVVKHQGKALRFRRADLVLERVVRIEGEGLIGSVYRVKLKNGEEMTLSHKQFLSANLVKNPVAIAIDKELPVRGGQAMVYIVEKTAAR